MNKPFEYLAEAVFGPEPLAELRRVLRAEYANIPSHAERTRLLEERMERDVRDTMSKVLPEYEKYLEITPENARESLRALGWTFPDNLDFTNFQLGYWIIESKPTGFGHQEGLMAYMHFPTKQISTGGWDSTG